IAAPVAFVSRSPEETRAVAARLARLLRPGDVVLLHGDLGAGKTTFAQGLGAALGVVDFIQSPTFTLVNDYAADADAAGIAVVHHLDLYRLDGDDELDSIGYDDYLAPDDGVSLIEWPERAAARLPERGVVVTFDFVPGGRSIAVIALAAGEVAERVVGQLRGQRA
ncbi:MAG TPA: tRNA (adenosine(37)-N6)-threonylcarbamoyltransferase complex ATPase subunit type 1 TsaE, partial [Thermomicrobiales bacterium]|nr:tRNA (adenosine(37)-N6)-threonylcarbamoyltransferase complex ATPase subunit type 1 TsaE [Thermomicrobiales bacterium]